MTKVSKRNLVWLAVGILSGALIIIAAHFFTIQQKSVHYHANFGLYVNGKRDEFKSFTFYEEVASCGGNDTMNPKIRTHMHNKVNYVVHVHDEAATWGHFFANLGYTLGDSVLKTDEGVFTESEGSENVLSFLLNGKPIETVANKTIGDKDVLLVSFGDETDSDLQKQYKTIKADAGKYDESADPAACTGTKSLTVWEKLQQSVWSKSSAEDSNHSH